MSYTEQTWDTTSKVNPTRMNHIEDGIKDNSDALDGLNATLIPLESGGIRKISDKFEWNKFSGGYYTGTNAVDISSIWDDMTDLIICVGATTNNDIWLNLNYGKGMGNGLFSVDYYYSDSYHSVETFSVNTTNKTVQLDSTWTKMVSGGNVIPVSNHRFYIYWR